MLWRSRYAPLTIAVFLAALVGSPASAQQGDPGLRVGLGYVGNAPEMVSGVSGHVLFPGMGRFGLYVDAKFNPYSARREETFLADRTAIEIEDEVVGVRFMDHKDSYRSFNAALVRYVNPSLMLYLGAGVSQMTRYREYYDPAEQMGQAGFFWVEAPDEAGSSLNVLGGAFLRMSSVLMFQTGVETNPKGFSVGISLQLPRRQSLRPAPR
jgi:hypothetical protein